MLKYLVLKNNNQVLIISDLATAKLCQLNQNIIDYIGIVLSP